MINCQGVAAVAALVVLLSSPAARAIDTQAKDFIPAPPGTNGALLYLLYGHNDGLVINDAEIPAKLDTYVAIPRFVHYFQVGGYTADINVLLPVMSLQDGEIGGASLGNASGIGDLSIVGTFWFYNHPETNRYVALAAYLNVPVGKYDPDADLNVGSNMVSGALQLGGTFGLSDRWYLDAVADVTIYGDNRNADGFGGVLTQDPTLSAQTWLTYQATDTFNVSAGYGIYGGGDQSVDNVLTGINSERQQVRLSASYFVTPTVQLLGQVNHDFDVGGGFQQDFSALFRIFKLF